MPTTLWIVGQHRAAIDGVGNVWEFAGVFDSEAKAVAACRDDYYFIAPATLNESLPHETNPLGWPGAYYPHLQTKSEVA